jgi:hypothetical protein
MNDGNEAEDNMPPVSLAPPASKPLTSPALHLFVLSTSQTPSAPPALHKLAQLSTHTLAPPALQTLTLPALQTLALPRSQNLNAVKIPFSELKQKAGIGLLVLPASQMQAASTSETFAPPALLVLALPALQVPALPASQMVVLPASQMLAPPSKDVPKINMMALKQCTLLQPDSLCVACFGRGCSDDADGEVDNGKEIGQFCIYHCDTTILLTYCMFFIGGFCPVFCPKGDQDAIPDLMKAHLNAHLLIPRYHNNTPEGVRYWAVHQMYAFCYMHGLVNLWAYLWGCWYCNAKWKLWACANSPLIPQLKTTMIVESQYVFSLIYMVFTL